MGPLKKSPCDTTLAMRLGTIRHLAVYVFMAQHSFNNQLYNCQHASMNSAYCVLLALAAVIRNTIATSQYYGASHRINIATVVSVSDTQDETYTMSAIDGGESVDRLDLILVANELISRTWFNNGTGFAIAADRKVLYQTASWSLIEDGSEKDNLLSSWAQFQSVDSTVTFKSICAMVVEWNSSWKEDKAVMSAVEVLERMTDKCGGSDTAAVAFTSVVSRTVSRYLEGKIAVNNAVAPYKMHDVHCSQFPAVSDRLFVRVANGAKHYFLASLEEKRVFQIKVFRIRRLQALQSTPKKKNGSDSNWQPDLYVVIPIGFCVFVIGFAGLVYLLRWSKNSVTTGTHISKEEEKDIPPSFSHVLALPRV
ncbi:unnamed protein product [Peronospora belbahrii]|uniref:Uncharacterized protein n=1 Tax=Peronospora belbahrii TaxID=622444 RepID=A0AAU9KRZ5_9STRA|nr:unnamed protein product [Peronospora belbahrii]